MVFNIAPQRVVVLRALQLGDILCAVPALRLLRALLPSSDITLIGLPWAQTLVPRYSHYLSNFLEFPGYPGLPERAPRLRDFTAFLSLVQRQSFDLAIQLQGNGTVTNPLTALFGAQTIAGFFRAGNYCPDPDRFLEYPETEPEIRRLLRLIEFLGRLPHDDRNQALEFPVTAHDRQSLYDIDEARRLIPGAYVCIHPGARSARRWPPNEFAAVADTLAAQGFDIVITGSNEEQSLCASVAGGMRASCINLAGRTGLGALAALVSNARLLVCNDTGIAHLAAALRVPSVNIFLGPQSDPGRWGPLDRNRHRVVYRNNSIRRVIAEVEDVLAKEPAYAAA